MPSPWRNGECSLEPGKAPINGAGGAALLEPGFSGSVVTLEEEYWVWVGM